MRKGRLIFYVHMKRIWPDRLTINILTFTQAKMATTPWVKQEIRYLGKAQVDTTEITDRKMFRENIYRWKVAPDKDRGEDQKPMMSKERRESLSIMMNNWWKNKRQLYMHFVLSPFLQKPIQVRVFKLKHAVRVSKHTLIIYYDYL